MTLSDTALSLLSLAGLVLAVVALALALRAGRRREPDIESLPPAEQLQALVGSHRRQIQRLEGAVRYLGNEQQKLLEVVAAAVQHVGLVRFDAFEDMGGQLSFSAALLDARGDGVVITSINGRQDTRCYAKRVAAGASSHNLTDEEEEAIRQAMGAVPQSARQTVDVR